MINHYKEYLDDFFSTLLDFKHTSNRLNKVLTLDFQKFSESGAIYSSNSALILSDWTGKTDNGWELPFYSGIVRETLKENYKNEIINVLSREFCLMYSQSFEALEKYFKDCVYHKSKVDLKFEEEVKKIYKIEGQIKRTDLKGGDKLYKLIKKIGKKTLLNLSKENNINIKFGELLTVLTETRHSIVHSKSVIEKSKINTTTYHFQIFKFLFEHSDVSNEQIKIELDFKKFEHLIKRLSEFAFQIFKAISLEEKLNWNYDK